MSAKPSIVFAIPAMRTTPVEAAGRQRHQARPSFSQKTRARSTNHDLTIPRMWNRWADVEWLAFAKPVCLPALG